MKTYFALFVGLLIQGALMATPPQTIPPALWNEYTLNGQIPVRSWYIDGTYETPKFYSPKEFEVHIQKALRRENHYYGRTDEYLFKALDELVDFIRDKEVALIGSTTPWYESILLTYQARPVVIEYNAIASGHPRVTYLTPAQYWANPRKFDLILSISSTEHDGLGRYGDPLNPNGDLRSMDEFKEMLSPDGKLLLAVPVGRDALVWNAHRIYGPIRLKMLLDGWRPLKYYGYNYTALQSAELPYQPVFLLQPKGVR